MEALCQGNKIEKKADDVEEVDIIQPAHNGEQPPEEPNELDFEAQVKLAKKKARCERLKVTCKYCSEDFATKQTLASHLAKGICLGKGYMCLRCFKVKRTPSELQRHQSSEKKCIISKSACIKRDEKGNVNVIIER